MSGLSVMLACSREDCGRLRDELAQERQEHQGLHDVIDKLCAVFSVRRPCALPIEVEKLRERLRNLEGTDDHPEHKCDRCGGRNISSWYADSDVWNQVWSEGGILCPICFCELAKEAGIRPTTWRLSIVGDSPEISKVRVLYHNSQEENARLHAQVVRLRACVKEEWDSVAADKILADVEQLQAEKAELQGRLGLIVERGGWDGT